MYQAVMIMHGVGVFVYFIGFIVKNIISLVHYSNLETVCSIMLINGVLIVGLSIYFMVYITYKIHGSKRNALQ